MMTNLHQKSLISALQGYRALAVLAVLIFHLDKTWMPGGYLGVDFFLLISGYIITKKISKDISAKKFSLKEFYLRRIKRLFPALFVTILLTVIGGFFILTPPDFVALCKSAFFGVISLANFYFLSVQGYFNPGSETQPLLHVWSLSIEEQFYLFWPPVLIFCAVAYRLWAAIILGVLSLAAVIFLAPAYPDAGFFLLPFRVYEFMTGAVLALYGREIQKAGLSILALLIGTALLIFAFFALHSAVPLIISGGVTMLGGTLLIASVRSDIAQKIYGLGPIVWIGNHSYSIYLVHWPIIVLYMYKFGKLSVVECLVLGLASIFGGWLLKSLVEDKLRWAPTGRAVATSLSIGLVTLVLSIGLLLIPRTYSESDFTALTVLDPTYPAGIQHQTCLLHPKQSAADMPEACIKPDPNRKNLLLFGSSVVADMRVGLEQALPEWNILQATATGCYPLPGPHKRKSCNTLRQRFFTEFAQNENYDLVLISGMGNGEDNTQYDKLTAALANAKIDYVYVGLRPRYSKDMMQIIQQYGQFEGVDEKVLETVRIPEDNPEYFEEGRYFSAVDVFCESDTVCKWREGNRNFYQDNAHISPTGSRYFGEAFAKWLETRTPPEN